MGRVLQPGGLLLLAANALAKDPDPQTTKALVQAVSDQSWVVRVGALEAIAKRGDPTLLPSIQGAMSDNKDVVSYRPLRPSSR
jgi:HEAT repeat protein